MQLVERAAVPERRALAAARSTGAVTAASSAVTRAVADSATESARISANFAIACAWNTRGMRSNAGFAEHRAQEQLARGGATGLGGAAVEGLEEPRADGGRVLGAVERRLDQDRAGDPVARPADQLERDHRAVSSSRRRRAGPGPSSAGCVGDVVAIDSTPARRSNATSVNRARSGDARTGSTMVRWSAAEPLNEDDLGAITGAYDVEPGRHAG